MRRERRRERPRRRIRGGVKKPQTKRNRMTGKGMADVVKAAGSNGGRDPPVSAANAMSTACEDVGPKKRTSRSLFVRRYAKARTQVNRNNDFRSGCQRATSM